MDDNNQLSVFVVDDDPQYLKACKRVLEDAGYMVSAFESPAEFLTNHDSSLPGCVVLDVGMMEMSGLETQQRLRNLGHFRPIVFVTGDNTAQSGVLALKNGARDYLLKPVSAEMLLAVVNEAVQADLKARRKYDEINELMLRWQTLTRRERDVMTLVIRGRLNKQIANDLDIVEKTVKVHRGRLMTKMGVRSVAGLVHIAEELEAGGIIAKIGAGDCR